MRINTRSLSIVKSNLVRNSFWGLISTVLQTLFLTIFFVIISRYYSTISFANYLIATTVYQFILGISTMGLGTWFIREFEHSTDKSGLLIRFIKIQTGLGLIFYLFNILLIFLLYSNVEIRLLGVVLGTNIIFDNIIYALSSLNIAQFKQKKTAFVMAIDSFFRLVIVSILFIKPISVVSLSILLVLIRLLTTIIFIKSGSSENITEYMWRYKISFFDIKNQVFSNWRFMIIVGLSIILWRSATIVISKVLTITDVANYEICYKILMVLIIIPKIISSTIYPRFVKLYVNKDKVALQNLFSVISLSFTVFSLLCYVFITSYANLIIPIIFGDKFDLAIPHQKEIFLTILVLPTVVLQANLIVAMKFEKFDMYFNLVALGIFFTICFLGFKLHRSLSVVTYSIFITFAFFHLIQNIFLIKLKMNSVKSALAFYIILASFVLAYNYGANFIDINIIFILFLLSFILFISIYIFKHRTYFLLTKN